MAALLLRLKRLKPLVPVLFCCPLLWLSPAAQAADPVSVSTQPLSAIALYPESSAAAVVASLNDAPIASQVDAPVLKIPVRVGDAVQAGAVLIQLNCRDFELERSRLQAERQAIQSRLELAEWQLKQSETLATQQSLPQEQVQEKRSQRGALRADLSAHAARLEITERQVDQCVVKAPFSGVVTARLVAVGQFVPRGTAVVRLLETGQPEVAAQVPSREVEALRIAEGLVFEHDGKRYPLKLRAVLPVIRTESGTQDTRLDFAGPPAESGAAGRLLWHNKTPYVPAEIQVKRDDRVGIFLEAGGVARFHALQDAVSGRPSPVALPQDTQIIVSGQFGLHDGDPVRVANAGRR